MRMSSFLIVTALAIMLTGCGLIEKVIFSRIVVRDGQSYIVVEDYESRALKKLEAAFGSISPVSQYVYAVLTNGRYRPLGVNHLVATPPVYRGPLGLGVYDEAERPLVIDVIEHINDDAPDNVVMNANRPIDNIGDAVAVLTGFAPVRIAPAGPLSFPSGTKTVVAGTPGKKGPPQIDPQ